MEELHPSASSAFGDAFGDSGRQHGAMNYKKDERDQGCKLWCSMSILSYASFCWIRFLHNQYVGGYTDRSRAIRVSLFHSRSGSSGNSN